MPQTTAAPKTQFTILGSSLLERYRSIRATTELLVEPLAIEDMVVQAMPDASPTRWHLAHTTWFFETFVLRNIPGYRSFHPQFEYLFNSYYNAVGPQWYRPNRGVLTRPTVAEVRAYRAHVDAAMQRLLEAESGFARDVVELGLNHEQQHQELILTDVKYLLAQNPLHPIYRERPDTNAPGTVPRMGWIEESGGIREIGFAGSGFAFDNESPRHGTLLRLFRIATRLVTNAEYLAFLDDGGYRRPELWLSDGWAVVRERGWQSPLYWENRDEQWWAYTLSGFRPVNDDEPVCHVSFYEADAYARWRALRLPSEAEWELVAAREPIEGNLLEQGQAQPASLGSGEGDQAEQFFGDVWEWTSSPYAAYPGYRPAAGALGEYNAKFMCNQMVLRGGSCVTPRSHIRATYRNFFPPDARWQFSGIRLAADGEA
ncbi:MAG: ergothioneine biosynthesis protein EgtB [Gemmatimonadetes bacterium]|nr:ergothioneine biosynthesis protein EgtB [Gemmatimonadota bacterium]